MLIVAKDRALSEGNRKWYKVTINIFSIRLHKNNSQFRGIVCIILS